MPDGRALEMPLATSMNGSGDLRLRLPQPLPCWDLAPLIDVVCREPGFTEYPFTGRTVQLQRELTLHNR